MFTDGGADKIAFQLVKYKPCVITKECISYKNKQKNTSNARICSGKSAH